MNGFYLTNLIFITALHGIYSLSFLELWSLSQGGYSLQILKYVATHVPCTRNALTDLSKIGKNKIEDRIKSLTDIKLVKKENNIVILTPVGRIVAIAALILRKMINLKEGYN